MNDQQRWKRFRELVADRAIANEGMMLLADEVAILSLVLRSTDCITEDEQQPNLVEQVAFLEGQLTRAKMRAQMLMKELDY